MADKLNEEDIKSALEHRPDWSLEGVEIHREFTLEDFASALNFVVNVGKAAEDADHHPDIFLHGWNKVRITLSTHSAGGLTAQDFALAATIDGLAG